MRSAELGKVRTRPVYPIACAEVDERTLDQSVIHFGISPAHIDLSRVRLHCNTGR